MLVSSPDLPSSEEGGVWDMKGTPTDIIVTHAHNIIGVEILLLFKAQGWPNAAPRATCSPWSIFGGP